MGGAHVHCVGMLVGLRYYVPIELGMGAVHDRGGRQELRHGIHGNPAIHVRPERLTRVFYDEWAQHKRRYSSGGRRHGDA